MDKGIIKRNFSRYARCYDEYAALQGAFALQLITKVGRGRFRKILDIGCGTGNYTRLLKDRFPFAEIKAVDISEEMIALAKDKLHDKRIEFIVRDAETIDFDENFDLITSNVSLQWFEDLEGTLGKYKNLLKRNGVILFSIFGSLTLHELNASLKELFKGASISSSGFIDGDTLRGILKKYFKKISVEEDVLKEKHDSLWELLNKIKYSGTRGSGINGRNILRSEIAELERIYKRKFTNTAATYQVFYCRAVK